MEREKNTQTSSVVTPALLVGLGAWQLLALCGWALGSQVWWLDAPNNGPQYSALAALLAVALALPPRQRLVGGGFTLLLFVHLVRWATGLTGGILHPSETGLTLLVANVHTENTDTDAVLELIRREQPDVVGLLEVDPRWLSELTWLRDGWPIHLEAPRVDNFGLALYARAEPHSLTEETLGSGAAPSLRLQTADGLVLWLTHPLPPTRAAYARDRDDQLAAVGALLQKPDVVVMGDLNVTPWSAHFPRGTHPVAGGTWPSPLPAMFRLPIDHVLVGQNLHLSELAVGPAIGSDHRPVLARVHRRTQ